jgi:hypothetical protein
MELAKDGDLFELVEARNSVTVLSLLLQCAGRASTSTSARLVESQIFMC